MFLKKSFTLLELVIVVIIVAALVGFGIPQMQKALDRARWAEVPVMLSAIRKACEIFKLETGRCAMSGTGYTFAPLNGPYKMNLGLSVDIPDPINNRYMYYFMLLGQTYIVWAVYDENGNGMMDVSEKVIYMGEDGVLHSQNGAPEFN